MRIPDYIELEIGETVEYQGHSIGLKQIVPEFQDYFEQNWHKIFHRALVMLVVDGGDAELVCAPYQLPSIVGHLVMQVDLVKGISGGTHPEPLTKDLRLAVLTGRSPFYSDCAWQFPIQEFRWRSGVTRNHSWNGFVQISDGKPYYHRGEDFAAIPDQLDVVTMTDGMVIEVPDPPKGGSNAFVFRQDGLAVRTAHMNARCLGPIPQAGSPVSGGFVYGKTGSTRKGVPATDPHFHMEIRKPEGSHLNTWPLLVQAYRNSWPREPLAMGGGFRFCRAGDSLTLSSSGSLSPDAPLLADQPPQGDFTWIFCDGTVARGSEVTLSYPEPGTWTEILKMECPGGRISYDFVPVRVSAEGSPPPFAFFFAGPQRNIRPGDSVSFWVHGINLEDTVLDFGDGSRQKIHPQSNPVMGREMISHSYSHSGVFIAELKGVSKEGHLGVFKLPVWVD